MKTRRAPVERTAPSDFRPRFCPSPHCDHHRLPPTRRYRYVRNGFYRRKCDRKRVQRFKCKRCGAGFSQQTFSVTYCMKRPDLLPWVANWIASGASLRRIARSHNGMPFERPCHPSTLPRISRRIGSQCLLALEVLRRSLPAIAEPIVSDHFETFAGMQENALGVATPVGARSWLVYALEPAWHRQATAVAKRRQRVAPTPEAIERSVRRMLDTLIAQVPEGEVLDLVSDDDPNHARAVSRHPGRHRIRHAAYRNPESRRKGEPRDADTKLRDAELFPVDLLHKLHRNWLADHHRETLAFAKRGEAVLERLAIFAIVRNLIQGVSERRNDATTPAMRTGLTGRPWRWDDVLAERRFPTRIRLGVSAAKVFGRTMPDPRGIAWPAHVRMRAL
jgi:hypothetical protein